MSKTPIMILRSIDINRGGVTKATIKRANLLSKKYKKVVILTTLFQQNHLETMRKLYKTELSKKVQVYNFFEYNSARNKKHLFRKTNKINIKEKGLVAVRVKHHADYSYRYYEKGLYVNYKRFDSEKRIVFIDNRKDGIDRTDRKEYDVEGNLVRVRHIDLKTNHPAFDQYYDKNQECFLSVHFNPKTKKEWSVVRFSPEVKNYRNLREAQSEWIKEIVEKYKNPVLISEQRQFDKDLVNFPKGIKKIIMVHSNHLFEPFDNHEKVDPPYVRLFKWLKEIDRLVLLTEEQRHDMEKVIGQTDKIKVIPHAYNKPKVTRKKNIKRDSLKVVVVARYVEDKRIDNVITAFKKVVEKIPDATLDIYGIGPLKKDLNKLIEKINLKKAVKIKGYTPNPHDKYREAACSVIISLREGFGMVITESLAVGTPVVAYDFKYGPKDIIKNNKNGVIVENGNIGQLSDAIIKILSNPELQKGMSKEALKVKKDFSEEKYRERWLELIKQI